MQGILSRALLAARPTADESARELGFARLLAAHVQKNAPAGCEAVLTGSMAKMTFLRDKRDIDIFVLFPRSVPRDSLEPAIESIMKSAFPGVGYQLSYAEHPYVRFHFQGRRIDLVPAYKITKAAERVSAVDRSVLHTKFVLGNLKKAHVGDVLLLKQFMRANGIYGAEIKVGGFSGYLCELLIIHHKGFKGLLRAAAKWKAPIFVDINKSRKGRKEVSAALEKFAAPLVVIDPTDDNRNVAAAVSKENLLRFVSLCKSFIKKPSDDFFFRRPETFEEKAEKASKKGVLYVLSMPRPDIVDDVLWGQLHKLMGQLRAHLRDFGPKTMFADDSRHIVRIAIVLERSALPPRMLVAGPPLSMKEHVLKFKKSHRKAKFVIKKKQIFAEAKRRVTGAAAMIHAFFREYSKTRSHLAYPEEMVVVEGPPEKPAKVAAARKKPESASLRRKKAKPAPPRARRRARTKAEKARKPAKKPKTPKKRRKRS